MTGQRTGRRPGPNHTRQAILKAARAAFQRDGYAATSVRGIARDAGVDPALVRRFYRDKHGLLLAVARVALDSRRLAARIGAGGLDGIGHRLVATALKVWEAPAGRTLVLAVQASPQLATLLVGEVTDAILDAARGNLPVGDDELRLRVGLVEVQMSGLFFGRYVLKAEPLASLPPAELVRSLGPLVQHLFTGPVGPYSGTEGRPR